MAVCESRQTDTNAGAVKQLPRQRILCMSIDNKQLYHLFLPYYILQNTVVEVLVQKDGGVDEFWFYYFFSGFYCCVPFFLKMCGPRSLFNQSINKYVKIYKDHFRNNNRN